MKLTPVTTIGSDPKKDGVELPSGSWVYKDGRPVTIVSDNGVLYEYANGHIDVYGSNNRSGLTLDKPRPPKPDTTAGARTTDGVEIVDGLRVFTNNLDRGTVDMSRADWEWHGPEGVWHLWFHVNCDINYKGEAMNSSYLQSDDRVATRYKGSAA